MRGPNPENATILRASLDGKSRSIFASGLRDTVGWGWQPQTGELWGMDNGMDALGDNLQPEGLNDIEKGKRYGYPHLDPPGGLQKSELPKTNIPMALGYTAHAAPMQMSFYNASKFPAEYQGDAFVSMRGSWNRKPPSGYEVVRIEVHLLPSVDVHELGATIDPQSAERLASLPVLVGKKLLSEAYRFLATGR